MSSPTLEPVQTNKITEVSNSSKTDGSPVSSTNGNGGVTSTNGDTPPMSDEQSNNPSLQSSSTSGDTKTESQPILAPSKLGAPTKTSSVLAPSRLFGSSFGGGGASQFGGFGKSLDNPPSNSKFKLKPSVLGSSTSSNPFHKAPAKDNDNINKSENKTIDDNVSSSTGTAKKNIFKDGSKSIELNNSNGSSTAPSSTDKSSPLNPLSNNSIKAPSLNVKSNFVFGQNLHTRVADSDGVTPATTSGEEDKSTTDVAPVADNLFSAAASAISSSDKSDINGKSLETSSRELEEKESREKRKFDEVEVITGEETESNVLQMNCKVYTWLKGGWVERGRGILRLNDWGSGGVEMHSRLVIRTQGTLTIMLNTKIWSEMNVEKASGRGVRFTAMDPDGQLKLYLIMGGTKDVELLFTSLEWRVSNNRRREQIHNTSSSSSNKKTKTDEDL